MYLYDETHQINKELNKKENQRKIEEYFEKNIASINKHLLIIYSSFLSLYLVLEDEYSDFYFQIKNKKIVCNLYGIKKQFKITNFILERDKIRGLIEKKGRDYKNIQLRMFDKLMDIILVNAIVALDPICILFSNDGDSWEETVNHYARAERLSKWYQYNYKKINANIVRKFLEEYIDALYFDGNRCDKIFVDIWNSTISDDYIDDDEMPSFQDEEFIPKLSEISEMKKPGFEELIVGGDDVLVGTAFYHKYDDPMDI